jgi:hypothetical protein
MRTRRISSVAYATDDSASDESTARPGWTARGRTRAKRDEWVQWREHWPTDDELEDM